MEQDEDLTKIVQKYWTDLYNNNEDQQFSTKSKEAFNFLKRVFKYNTFAKRDGSIVNSIKISDDQVITDLDEINRILIEVLKKIQLDQQVPLLQPPDKFPSLDPLQNLEMAVIV